MPWRVGWEPGMPRADHFQDVSYSGNLSPGETSRTLNDFVPSPTRTHNLGSPTEEWENAYIHNLHVSGSGLDVTGYGATPDAQAITTGSTTSGTTTLTAPSGTFAAADVGKHIRIRNQSTKAVVFKGSISAFVASTQVTLSGNASATLTGNAWVVWGTDNATAIQAALDAAEDLVTGPTIADFIDQNNFPLKLGAAIVKFPVTTAGSMYLYSTQLSVARKVDVDAEAMLFNNAGDGTASDRVWGILFLPGAHCSRLVMDCGGGMGVKFGTVLVQSNSYVGIIQLWHPGSNNNALLTPPDQTAIQVNGYDYHVNKVWIKGGGIGLDLSTADMRINQAEIIGSGIGCRIFDNGNVPGNIQINQLTLDSIGSVGFRVEVGAEITARMHYFGATGTYGIDLGSNVGIYNVHSVDLELAVANNSPITALRVANTIDSRVRMNLSNEIFGFASATPITKMVEYGTGNSGFLDIDVVADSAIATVSSGTQYGLLRLVQDDKVTIFTPPASGAGQYIIKRASDATNAAVLELHNGTNSNYWHIPVRSGSSDQLRFYGNNGTFNPAAWMDITGKFWAGNLAEIRVVDGVKFATIAAAIADLPAGGGTVAIPAGTYTEQVTLTKSNVALILDPNTILAPTAAGAAITIGDGGATDYRNIKVIGGQIKPSGASPTRGIYLRGSSVGNTVQHLFIETVVDGTSASNANFDGIYGDGVLDNITIGPDTYVSNCVRDGYSFQSTSIIDMNQIRVMGRANNNTRYGLYGTLITGIHYIGGELATQSTTSTTRALRYEGINGGSVVSATLRSNILTAVGNVVTAEFVNNGATSTSSVAVVGCYIDGDPNATGGRIQITTSNNITFEGNTFVSQASGSSIRITGTVTDIYNLGGNLNYSIDTAGSQGDARLRRYIGSGTALVAGDFALSANWGVGAAVSAVTGTDAAWQITVTAAGVPGASPTITLTFKDGTWTNAPICISKMTGGTGTVTDLTETPTATTNVITFGGTPVAGSTYIISSISAGRP